MTGTGALSIGVAAAVGPQLAARLAPAVEAAGFHALWVNDTPGNDALAVLAAAARETESLVLATGVVPVDRRPPAEILDRVSALALPEDRLLLGIGSGGRREGALALVADAAAADRIRDFSRADGDRIDLGQVDADPTLAEDQAFTFLAAGAFTGVAGQLHYLHAGGNTFVEGDTDGDGAADFVIRPDGPHTLAAGDFVL